MSDVTGVVLMAACGEEEVREDGPLALADRINEWLAERANGHFWSMESVEHEFGGGKHPQMTVYGGGLNGFYCDKEFVEFVFSLPWDFPEHLILVISPEEGVPSVHRPKGYGDG